MLIGCASWRRPQSSLRWTVPPAASTMPNRNEAVTAASPMAVAVEEEKVKEREAQKRRDAKAAAEAAMTADKDKGSADKDADTKAGEARPDDAEAKEA